MNSKLEHLHARIAELEKLNERLGKSLQQSEERFFKIFHASSNLMAITTVKDGRIVDLNEASANLGGFKREELIGTYSTEHSLWAEPKQRDMVIRKVYEEGSVHNMEVAFLGKSGELHKALFSADPIFMDGEPCMLSVSVDITALEKKADALRKSEEKYRMLVENSLQGLVIGQEGRVAFSNNAFAAISGYSVEELFSLPDVRMILHPDDREIAYKRQYDRLAGKQVSPHYEFRIIRKDGTERLLEAFASVIEYNEKPAIQTVYMDITERKQAENALRESEERFRLIAETIDEIFWVYDTEKEVTIYISPAYDRIWGYPRESFIGSQDRFLDPIFPDDLKRVVDVSGQMKNGRLLDFEFRITRSDGSIRYIWNRGFPVPDHTGRIKRYVGVGQDVTARRRAEEALKESREYLNQIINHIGDPIFVKDHEHKIVLVNDAFCSFQGMEREKLIGDSVMPEGVALPLWEQEEEVLKTGMESLTEEVLVDGQGNSHTVMTKKSLLTDQSGNKQIVGVLRDITEYKRLEAQFMQAQKMEAIGVLAGGVAHDFNNLLNVINGYTELMLGSLDQDSPLHKDLKQIWEAGQRAAALTSQLLAFGRKQILQPEILDLNAIITQVSPMLRRLIGEDIEFVPITRPNLGLIHADPGQIQQIIMNLTVNARDAMPHGGRLSIETANVHFEEDYIKHHPVAKAGSYSMLAISDNGVGMDSATQARIFEPFFTTKEKGKGTGLGLSTVYGIVKQSSGLIWVYSEPGKGTTFKIYFPHAVNDSSRFPERSKSGFEFRGHETVLVVEDEASVRALACRILRDRGYNVLEAADGMEAMRTAQKHEGEIHLILTDVIMPGISGRALVDRLIADRPGVKALFVSGYTDDAIVHHGILDSNVAFLQKPFTVEGLARKVWEVLNS